MLVTAARAKHLLAKWIECLRLQAWEMTLQCESTAEIEDPISGRTVFGYCDWDYTNLYGEITVATQRTDAEVEATIRHELLHLILLPLEHRLRVAVQALSPEACHAANADADRIVEQTVRMIERALEGER